MAVSKVAEQAAHEDVITMDRRRGDRRQGENEVAGSETTPPAKRKKQRRRHIDPTTCERDYNEDEIEFMRAMDDYKRDAGRMFPTCSEVLEVIRNLGYVKLTPEQVEGLQVDEFDEENDFEIEADEEELGEE